MPRDLYSSLEDINQALAELNIFINKSVTKKEFFQNIEKIRAVERNLEIIGEAAKNIPPELRSLTSKIPWKKIIGIRDILAHAYFNVDKEILWDIIQNYLSDLSEAVLFLQDHSKTKPKEGK